MSDAFAKSISHRLGLVAKLHRARALSLLAEIGLYPGQETILKELLAEDGRLMGELAAAMRVRPPTVTKMVARLGAQGLVERRATLGDGRQARVFLTETGRVKAGEIDALWRRLDKETLKGMEEKERKRLRKLLRQVARNLSSRDGVEASALLAEPDIEVALAEDGPDDDS